MRGSNRAISQNAGKFLIVVQRRNVLPMRQRCLGRIQVLQGNFVVTLVGRHTLVSLRFLQVESQLMGFLRGFGECVIGLRRLGIADPGRRLLHHVVDAVGIVMGLGDGLVVLNPRLALISHQRICVCNPDLRRSEIRIHLQSHAIVRERVVEVPRHA